MFVLVLSQANLVPDGLNNKFIYKFPNSILLKDKYIAISNISMYYSWFNITSALGNNTLYYTWTSGAVTTTYTIIIPDGLYEVSAINNYCQFFMIQQGTYWINSVGDYVYPFEILLNPTRYAVQINTFLIPTALPVGSTIPGNFAGWPTITQNPVITIPSGFNSIIGYTAGFVTNANLANAYVPPTPATVNTNYATKDAVGTLSYLSNTSPQVQPNNTVLFSVSNINNPYTQPSSIIFSLNPNVAAGSQISVTPPNFMWNKMIDGTYSELRLSLLGSNLQPLTIRDPNITILLTIRDQNEGFLASK